MTTQKEVQLQKKVEEQKEKLHTQQEQTKVLQSKLEKEADKFKIQFAERTLKLVTSGFGLVAALAWNELIKEVVSIYIKPYFGKNSGLISLLIYALIVTFLAVAITYNLSKLSETKEDVE